MSQVLACPEGFSGALDLSCHRGEVTVLKPSQGTSQCHQSCAKGVTMLGSLEIPHPALQHGEVVELTCPDGYTGKLLLCFGVVESKLYMYIYKWMYVCICIHTYIFIFTHTYTWIYTYVDIYIYV